MLPTDLIDALGGATAVAGALGLRRNTVNMWKIRQNIPPEYYLPVWKLAIASGVEWAPPQAEGFALVPADVSPSRSAA